MTAEVRVGLLFGGSSVEHEISVLSARSVALAMKETSLTCIPLGVTGDGRWLSPERSHAILDSDVERVESDSAHDDGASMGALPGGGGLLTIYSDRAAQPLRLDAVFPLVHGWGGEDGRLQGMLELADVAYVGAGVLGSAAGMDKAVSKRLFAEAGLAVGPWVELDAERTRSDDPKMLHRVADEIGYPVFVKPTNGGSSLGISRVARPEELPAAVELAWRYDGAAVIERGLDAREIECAVLGNAEPEASGLGEIEPSGEFYDYDAKYLDDSSRLLIPAPLPQEVAEEIRRLAVLAYRAVGLEGFARVDFLLDRKDGTAYINEVNTLPGFTSISMFPKLWEAAGLAYPELVERLVELALARREREKGRVTLRD